MTDGYMLYLILPAARPEKPRDQLECKADQPRADHLCFIQA